MLAVHVQRVRLALGLPVSPRSISCSSPREAPPAAGVWQVVREVPRRAARDPSSEQVGTLSKGVLVLAAREQDGRPVLGRTRGGGGGWGCRRWENGVRTDSRPQRPDQRSALFSNPGAKF